MADLGTAMRAAVTASGAAVFDIGQSRMARVGSGSFDSQSNCVAPAEAQRRNPFRLATLLQCMEQRDQYSRPAGANRVSNGYGAAVNIYLCGIEAEVAVYGQRLDAECLVQLEQIYVGEGPTCAGSNLADGGDGGKTKPLRLDAAGGLGTDYCERLEAESLGAV